MGARGKVLALEPQPQIFDLLLRNLEQNEAGNVEARNCAAAAKRQLLAFPRLDLSAEEKSRLQASIEQALSTDR